MSAYAYCQVCDSPMSRPDLSDIQYDTWQCSQGHHNAIRVDKAELLCEIIDELRQRLETLESLYSTR